MKELIRNLWAEHSGTMTEKSLLNCHVMGVHSIVLTEKPMVRVFVTDPHHELWKNFAGSPEKLSVAFHPHHCDLTLLVTRGRIVNTVAKESMGSWYTKYRYFSAINSASGSEECKFSRLYSCGLDIDGEYLLKEGQSYSMDASEIHTVAVTKGEIAAWAVIEGEEDPDYDAVSYSDRDLTRLDASTLYLKPDRAQVAALLGTAGLL